MSKYINPFTDFGFKLIFGSNRHKTLLISFLNELFRDEPNFEPITEVEYSNKELLGDSDDERRAIYDVLCTTALGHQFIVEMQNRTQYSFIDRSLYYVSKSIVEQAKQGNDWDFKYHPVYMVSFLNFTLENLGDDYRSDIMLLNVKTHEPVTDKVRFTYLQLPIFEKETEEQCNTKLEKWLFNLIHMENLEYMPFADEDNTFKVLESAATYGALSREDRIAYDRSLKAYRDYNNTIAYAVDQARLDIARNLFAIGMPMAQIIQVTGLTESQLNTILGS